MKKLILIVLVVAMLAAASPVFASGKRPLPERPWLDPHPRTVRKNVSVDPYPGDVINDLGDIGCGISGEFYGSTDECVIPPELQEEYDFYSEVEFGYMLNQ